MKKVQVLTSTLYTSRKTGRQSWRCTAVGEEGAVVFFAPFEDEPKKGDIYTVDIAYSSYEFSYKPVYKKA